MKKKIIVLIGFGSIGNKHYHIIKDNIKYDKLLILGNKKKIPKSLLNNKIIAIKSFDEIIEHNVNFAIISSPAPFHLEYAIKLARYNINILIEKPLSHNFELKKYNRLMMLVKVKKIKCFIGYVFRNDDLLINFKKILNKINYRSINHIYSDHLSYLPEWRNIDYKKSVSANKNLGGGVILESSHEIDYLQYLFGNLQVLSSHLRNSGELKINVEDSAEIFFSTKFNSSVLLNLNFNSKIKSRKCKVHTKKINITCDFKKRIIYSTDFNDKKKIIYKSNFSLHDAYVLQDKNFINKKISSKLNYCNLKDGIKTMKLINKIFN